MAYFNRLTDIVTCNLSKLLADEPDPSAALEHMIGEMEEGLAGARRSVATASAEHSRLTNQLAEHRAQMGDWFAQAKEHLQAGNEEEARLALYRKNEVADLVAGLEQQLEAAVATRDHLTTTLGAIEARLADARRRHAELGRAAAVASTTAAIALGTPAAPDDARSKRVEQELDRLKSELRAASTRHPQ